MNEPWSIHDGLAIYGIGTGEPILLMPGPHRFARPGLRSTDALIDGLRGLGRRVITYDPPGSGRSTRSAHLSMEEMHDCADEALAVSGITGPVDLIGHSMSGLAALAYTIERSARVRRLVLIGTGTGGRAYMSAPGALWNASHPHFWPMVLLAMLHIVWPTRGPERILNNFIARESFWDRRLARRTPVTVRDWFRPREGRTDWHRVARTLNYAPRLAEVTAPTLVLCGRHDPQYPPACSEELVRGIRNAQAVFFAHSGHFPFLEEPTQFWSAVDTFLVHAPEATRASASRGERR